MTGWTSVLATCERRPRSYYPVIYNATKEDQWRMDNVECYTLAAVISETVQATC